MPNFADKSDGMQRRITILPFAAKFTPKDPDYDPDITDKVTTDAAMSYLLNLAIEGLHDLRKRGRFIQPRVVAEANEGYKVDSSSILQWFEDMQLPPITLQKKPIQAWYEQYKQWCHDAGYAKPFSRRQFVMELSAKYELEVSRKRTGAGEDTTGKGSQRHYYFELKNPRKIKLK